MFIFDALLQVWDFFLSIIMMGQLPQENFQAGIYNFVNAVWRFLGLIA